MSWTSVFSVGAPRLPLEPCPQGRSELCAVLDSLDVAWAGFEHKPLDVLSTASLRTRMPRGVRSSSPSGRGCRVESTCVLFWV